MRQTRRRLGLGLLGLVVFGVIIFAGVKAATHTTPQHKPVTQSGAQSKIAQDKTPAKTPAVKPKDTPAASSSSSPSSSAAADTSATTTAQSNLANAGAGNTLALFFSVVVAGYVGMLYRLSRRNSTN